MRIATTLLLATTAMLGAALPLHAQSGGAGFVPAVPAVPAKTSSATPSLREAAPAQTPDAPPSAEAPPSADAAPNTDVAPVAAAAPANSTVAAVAPGAAAAPTTPGARAGVIDAKDDPDNFNSVAATVNDEAISDYELRQRIALFVSTSGLQPDAEQMKRIRGQILEKLEDEKLQLQEAVKKHITVSPVEVDKQISSLLSQNNLTIEQLRGILAAAGASELALKAQITAQIAWQKTVQEEYSDRVNISPAQVDAEVQRYADGANKPHFLVSEIFLPVSNPEKDSAVQKDAQNIESQIKAGAPFAALARQFSQNPAAAQGGSIGWVHEGQLANELNSALVQMTPGSMSSPIRAAGGYYILLLQARQEPLGTKISNAPAPSANADGSLPLSRLLLPLGPSPSKELVENGMKVATQIRGGFQNCAQLKEISTKIPGSVFMDLGNMKPSDLSPEIQKALAQTQSGTTTAPLVSDAGVELIARCDKKVEVQTAYTMPTRQQVEANLFDQQISALAQRYLRDLKRDANVEVR